MPASEAPQGMTILENTRSPSEWNAQLYREVNQFAQGLPSWVHTVAEIGTEAGLLLFAMLFVLGWWRARREENKSMAVALLVPVVTIGAYLISETVKSVIREARPCNAMQKVQTIADCPPTGDWSLPSNHATVVAACPAAIIVARPRMAFVVVPLAALMGFSRVFIGVHYPYDVVAGFALGAIAAPLLTPLLAPPCTLMVKHLRRHRLLRPLLAAKPASKAQCGRF